MYGKEDIFSSNSVSIYYSLSRSYALYKILNTVLRYYLEVSDPKGYFLEYLSVFIEILIALILKSLVITKWVYCRKLENSVKQNFS